MTDQQNKLNLESLKSKSLNTTINGIIIADTNGVMLWGNSAFLDLTGYSLDEIVGRSMHIFNSGQHPSEHYKKYQDLALSGDPWQDSIIVRGKDGNLHHINLTISPIKDEQHQDPYFIAIMEDITDRKRMENELRRREREYSSLVENTTDLIARFDTNLRYIYCNQEFERRGSRPISAYIGRTILEVNARKKESVLALDKAARQVLETGEIQQVDHDLLTVSGFRSYQTLVFPEYNEDGRIASLFSVSRDITEFRQAEEQEREQRELAEALRRSAAALNSTLNFDDVLDLILDNVGLVVPHDAANIMLLDVDSDMVSLACQRGYVKRGASVDEIEREYHLDSIPILKKIEKSGQPVIVPDTHTFPDWTVFPITKWVRSYLSIPIQIKKNTVGFINLDSETVGFFDAKHAQQLKAFADHAAIAIKNSRLYEEVRTLAIVDPLTGLYNRRGFFEICRREVGRLQRFGRHISVLFVDIDHFKQFNDRYSYEVGDQVLQQVADILQGNVREVDVVCRYGGEEMIALLPEIDQIKAIVVAERLRKAVEGLHMLTDQGKLNITVSIGIATLRSIQGQTIVRNTERQKTILENLIAEAGQALRTAKYQGRNQVVVYQN